MRAYSLDLRERVLAAIDADMSHAHIAATFRISERTISRWLARRQAGRPLVGGTGPGRRHSIPDAALPALRVQLETHPDATLAEHLTHWNAHHPPVSQSALARAIRRAGWTRKKRLSMPVNKTTPRVPPSEPNSQP